METSSRVAQTWNARPCHGLAIFLFFLVLPQSLYANTLLNATQATLTEFTHIAPKHAQCVIKVSNAYKVPLEVLLAVLSVEKGAPDSKNINNNGSYDYGPGQINTIRFPEIKHFIDSQAQLKEDSCTNILTVGYLLHQHIHIEKLPFWTAIGTYHYRETGDNPKHHYEYIFKVAKKRGLICKKNKALCSQT